MTNVTLGILGLSPCITVTTPAILGATPQSTMAKARRRYASQGARRVTLVPKRDGEGWVVAARAKAREGE